MTAACSTTLTANHGRQRRERRRLGRAAARARRPAGARARQTPAVVEGEHRAQHGGGVEEGDRQGEDPALRAQQPAAGGRGRRRDVRRARRERSTRHAHRRDPSARSLIPHSTSRLRFAGRRLMRTSIRVCRASLAPSARSRTARKRRDQQPEHHDGARRRQREDRRHDRRAGAPQALAQRSSPVAQTGWKSGKAIASPGSTTRKRSSQGPSSRASTSAVVPAISS